MPAAGSHLVLAEYESVDGARTARVERTRHGWVVWRRGARVETRVEVATEQQAKRVARFWVRGGRRQP